MVCSRISASYYLVPLGALNEKKNGHPNSCDESWRECDHDDVGLTSQSRLGRGGQLSCNPTQCPGPAGRLYLYHLLGLTFPTGLSHLRAIYQFDY